MKKSTDMAGYPNNNKRYEGGKERKKLMSRRVGDFYWAVFSVFQFSVTSSCFFTCL